LANGGKELRVSTKAVTAACDDEEAAHDPRHAAAPVLVLRAGAKVTRKRVCDAARLKRARLHTLASNEKTGKKALNCPLGQRRGH